MEQKELQQQLQEETNWESKSVTDFLNEYKPIIRNEFDGAILAILFTMKRLGFRCTSCSEQQISPNVTDPIPNGWNQSFDSYSFSFRHPRSGMTFIVKALTLGEKLLIHALTLEDNKTKSIEINASEFVNKEKLTDYSNLYKDSQHLIALFRINVIDHLLPSTKEGYQPGHISTSTSSQQSPSRNQREPDNDYDFDYDPLRVPNTGNRRPQRSPLQEGPPLYPQPFIPPFGMGGNDLYPTGPGFGPQPFIPPNSGGGLMGPNHPGFGNDPYHNPQFIPPRRGRGPYPPSHPQGARFDPFGPPNVNPYGEPDSDDLPPPNSYGNMYL